MLILLANRQSRLNMRAYVKMKLAETRTRSDAKQVKSISFLLHVSLLKLFVPTSGNAVVGKYSSVALFRLSECL